MRQDQVNNDNNFMNWVVLNQTFRSCFAKKALTPYLGHKANNTEMSLPSTCIHLGFQKEQNSIGQTHLSYHGGNYPQGKTASWAQESSCSKYPGPLRMTG